MAEYLRYVVKAGDTMNKIAKANETTAGELVALNAIADPDLISVGQILNIRRISDTSYTVLKGDTLSAIAAHYGVTVASIVHANAIDDPNRIAVGTSLAIPTGSPASALPPLPVPSTGSGGAVPVPGAALLAAARIARRSVLKRSIGYCYRYVKNALLAGGATSQRLSGVAAAEAGSALVGQGFIDILGIPGAGIKSPYDAPEGAVIVYKATPSAIDKNRIYGHIEIRTSDGFASDYFSPRARTGPRENGLTLNSSAGRSVSGVYVKPDRAAAPAAVAAAPPPAVQVPGAGVDPFSEANLKLPSVNGKYHAAIIEAAKRTAMAPQTIAAIIDAEAAKIPGTGQWNANSKASTSSATGLTQFLDGTWRGEARRAGGILNAEAKSAGVVNTQNVIVDDKRLLAMRFDPRMSILAGADYAVANLAILRAAQVLPNPLPAAAASKFAYLAHHEGPSRAIKFLRGQMGYVTTGIISANVPNSAKRAALIQAAGGDIGKAYRDWFAGYVDTNIDVRRFMHVSDSVNVPKLRTFFL